MRQEQGFTLVELLIASFIALLILGFIAEATISAARINARENQNIPAQQQLRASIEVISQEIRDSVGPRVMYPNMNGVGVALPSALPVSTATSLTLFIPEPNSTFIVAPPVGYPTTTTLAARSATALQNPSLTDAISTSQDCAAVFTTAGYAVLYGTQQTNYLSGAARNPDAFRIMQTSTCPSSGATAVLAHPVSPLPLLTWNPNTYVVKVTPVTYTVSSNVLYRTIAGQTAQVVAYNISSFTVSYLPENPIAGVVNCETADFKTAAGCAPRQLKISLTSTPQNAGVVGSAAVSATQLVFLR